MPSTRAPGDARTAFLRELIDDAALFPPASASMPEAVKDHDRHRDGPHGWIQGRFLCPASRLAEFADALPDDEIQRPVALICDSGWEELAVDLQTAAALPEWTRGHARVETVELALTTAQPDTLSESVHALIDEASTAGLDELEACYLEPPRTQEWSERLPELAARIADQIPCRGQCPGPQAATFTHLRLKLRCGGTTPDAYPSPEEVGAFVTACVAHGVAFKATAGLHHALPCWDEASGARMYGFLALLGGALLHAAGSINAGEYVELLAGDEHPTLDSGHLRWRDRQIDAATIAGGRRELLASYGSCSFDEPTEELTELGSL